jgi:hypothetical protein
MPLLGLSTALLTHFLLRIDVNVEYGQINVVTPARKDIIGREMILPTRR